MVRFCHASIAAAFVSAALAQTFQRLGTCPTLGCILPPDQVDFFAGQYFDIRLEVHAPVNGSEANGGVPDSNFKFTITKPGEKPQDAASFFKVAEPKLETWNFTWYEDLFARDALKPSVVRVASKAYRRVALYEPGDYHVSLTYYNGSTTNALWHVKDLAEVRKAKNVLLFIGDGMTTNMITAARLIAHKSVNGRYKSRMAMDKFPILGHSMTHSIDSFITDSANSATALYTGKKAVVNALGVWTDSSKNSFDDPKVETIAEMFHRIMDGHIGIVSTAFIADATPAALTAHTANRGEYGAVVDSFLHGITNYTWTNWTGPDVLFGGGAEQFYTSGPEANTYQGKNYYDEFAKAGYKVVQNKTALLATSDKERTLGIFSVSNMAKWLDRNVFTANLKGHQDSPDGKENDASDQPGLKEMTLKAIDILHNRSGSKGWFLMSEAASIDKMMHSMDYDRALGELLELDDTIRASIEKLKTLGELNNTLIVVTADHGHGFDVFGSADTQYMDAQKEDRKKRGAIGTYKNSGLSQYTVGSLTYGEGVHFPAKWDPRYTLAEGFGAHPDVRENYRVHKDGVRVPAINITAKADYYVNYKDAVTGFVTNGTLSVDNSQGVHSLTDVPCYAMGPCQELFQGSIDETDIFFGMARCLGLGRSNNKTVSGGYNKHGY